jgi:indole-3-glycerol phosphate synthase
MILEQIVRRSEIRAEALASQGTGTEAGARPGKDLPDRSVISLREAILGKKQRNAIIAEMKPASPSRGHIRTITDPVAVAGELTRNGCSALSVITEPSFFQGTTATIQAIRDSVRVPILRKDFIVDRNQLVETKNLGADAVLLITAVLSDALPEFVDATLRLGLEPLVEVHSKQELRIALDSDANLIGVNNRNLKTMQTDISLTCRLGPLIRQAGRTVIAESGLVWPCDIRTLRPYAQGYLIGSSIMASGNPGKRLEGFVSA